MQSALLKQKQNGLQSRFTVKRFCSVKNLFKNDRIQGKKNQNDN